MVDIKSSYHGIDTVRFRALTGYVMLRCPITGEHNPHIELGEDQAPMKFWRYHQDAPVFELSAYVFYDQAPGYLAPVSFLLELQDLYAAEFMRVDLAAHLDLNVTMEALSYLRWHGRRSLQKKRDPWAFWPSEKKTLKFYDKNKQHAQNKTSKQLYPAASSVPLRFEIELRGKEEREAMINSRGFNYQRWQSDLDHFLRQLQPLDIQGLSDLHCRVILLHLTGNLDSSKLTHRGKKALKELDQCGLLREFFSRLASSTDA